jgi:DEAD/DEAH box helicase domain-containing protein
MPFLDGALSPHHQVAIRGVNRDAFTLLDGAHALGTIEPPQLQREAHPGAIYLHLGRSFRVEELDRAARVVRLTREPGAGRTDPSTEVTVVPTDRPLASRILARGELTLRATLGPVVASELVIGFRETGSPGRQSVKKMLDPPLDFALNTIGLWVDLPEALGAQGGSLHAMEHALVNVLPLRLLSDRGDVGSANDTSASAGGRITLYDRYEGGIGLAEHAYQMLDELLDAAAELMSSCPCADGCSACTQIPGCTQANEALDKRGGLGLLQGRRFAPPTPARQAAPVGRSSQ